MDVGGRSGDMAVFATVAEQGSLSAAALALGLTPSAVSRIIAHIGEFSVAGDLQRGDLVPLLQAFNPGDREPVHAVFVGGLVVVLARQDESGHRPLVANSSSGAHVRSAIPWLSKNREDQSDRNSSEVIQPKHRSKHDKNAYQKWMQEWLKPR